MRMAPILAMIACLALAQTAPAEAESRLALVIGNSDYRHTPPLANPAHDAELMAATLASVGFEVTKLIDADQATMKLALVEFGRKLRGSDAVGLFYYAGHGAQVRGENYLIPVDANITDEAEVPIAAVNVNEFLATMERAESRINIVILDACRNNPFIANQRSATRGLARVEAPSGTYIAYATAPGQVAEDGSGGDSPYTKALATAITTPGIPIEQVFKKARSVVQAETDSKQTPWETSSITGDFFFVPPTGSSAPPSEALAPAPPQPKADSGVEIAFWNSIKDGNNREAYQSYLGQYPSGAFAALAKLKLKEIDQAAKPQVIPQATPAPSPPERSAIGPSGVVPSSSAQALSPQVLATLDCDRLWVARNEIFHRNGYCFQTARGKAYFGNSNCRTSSQNILTAVERQNVELIKSWESRKSCR
jgi:hypothetical protein